MLEDWSGSAWPRRSEMRGPSPASAARFSFSPWRKSNTCSFWLLKHSDKLLYFECFTVLVLPLQKCTVKNGEKNFQLTEGLHFLKTVKLPEMFLKHGNWSACRRMLFLSQAIFQFSSYPATASFCFCFSFDYVHLSPKRQSFKVWHKL